MEFFFVGVKIEKNCCIILSVIDKTTTKTVQLIHF